MLPHCTEWGHHHLTLRQTNHQARPEPSKTTIVQAMVTRLERKPANCMEQASRSTLTVQTHVATQTNGLHKVIPWDGTDWQASKMLAVLTNQYSQ